MNKNKQNKLSQWTHSFLILVMTLNLTACGFFSDEPVEDQDVYQSTNLQANCKLDPDSFGQIFNEDISTQINCLEENFRQFLKFVRTDVPDSVGSGELERFIEKFFRANSETMIKSLGLLFELNTILLRDELGQISSDNITPLFKLLVVANREAVIITNTLKAMSEEGRETRFWELREELKGAVERFSASTIGIITKTSKLPQRLDIREFIVDLNQRLDNFEVEEKTVDSMLFLKRIFIGGNRQVLTSVEAGVLIEKFPKLAMLAIDLFFSREKNFENKSNHLRFYNTKVSELEALWANVPTEENLFTTSDIIQIITTFASDFDLDKYRELIYGAKEHLIGGDRENYNFGHLHNVFAYIKVGIHGLIVADTYERAKTEKDVKGATLPELRVLYTKQLEELALKTRELIEATPTIPETIGLHETLQLVNEHFLDLKFKPELITSALVAKKLIEGGERLSLSKTELLSLTHKLKDLALLLYDFNYQRPEGDRPLFNFILERFHVLKKNLAVLKGEELILDNNDLINIIQYFMDEETDAQKFKPTLEKFKGKIIGGDINEYTSGDVQSVISMMQDLIERMAFNATTFEEQEKLLTLNIRLNSVPVVWSDDYRFFSQTRLNLLRGQFNHLVKSYKFLREPVSGYQYYSHQYHRSSRGFTELAVVKWAAEKVARAYGTLIPGKSNEYRVDMKATNTILYDYKPALEELGLWSKSPETFARNMLLLSDLFTTNSDGDYQISVNEITEYGPLVITAMKIGEELITELTKRCGSEPGDEDRLINVTCSRAHYFDVLLNKLEQKKFMPHLNSYIETIDEETRNLFLAKIEGFARDIKRDEVPINKRDYMLIYGAMLNIESTFLRYDVNKNNVVDNDELREAFKTYRQAIIDIAKLDESKVKYAESIFLYLIQNMEIPSTSDLLWFHYLGNKDDIVAERLNIGTILNFLVTQANSAQKKE